MGRFASESGEKEKKEVNVVRRSSMTRGSRRIVPTPGKGRRKQPLCLFQREEVTTQPLQRKGEKKGKPRAGGRGWEGSSRRKEENSSYSGLEEETTNLSFHASREEHQDSYSKVIENLSSEERLPPLAKVVVWRIKNRGRRKSSQLSYQ